MTETELNELRGLNVGRAVISDSGYQATSLALSMYRLAQWLRSPRPYLMLIGFAGFLGFWYLSVEVWKLPRFAEMPGPTQVLHEWFSRDPTYGLSIFV